MQLSGRRSASVLIISAVLSVCAMFGPSAQAIVVCDNIPAHVVANTATSGSVTSELGMVGYFYINGMRASGTLIAPDYVLLAGHEVTSANYKQGQFRINGQTYGVEAYARYGSAADDVLAIVKLKQSTLLPGYRLNVSLPDHDYGSVVVQGTILGCGYSGVRVADTSDAKISDEETSTSSPVRGILRYGYNELSKAVTYNSTSYLGHDFDYNNTYRVNNALVYLQDGTTYVYPGDSLATLGSAYEVGIANGDSGGPTLITDSSGKYYVAGIHTMAFIGAAHHCMMDIRVKDYVSWITTVVLTDGDPATVDTTIPAALQGDVNDDRKVDATDLATLRANFGKTTGATWAMGDFTSSTNPVVGDGAVNYLDQLVLGANYNVGVWTAKHVGAIPGNANADPSDPAGDRQVDVADFDILAANFGLSSGATWAMGDFDSDGDVDAADYAMFADNFGWGVQDLAGLGEVPDCPGTGRITGTVVLQHYAGDVTTVPVRIKLLQNEVVVRDVTVYLDSTGRFVLKNVPGGTYDIWVKASHWLSMRKNGIVVTPAVPVKKA